LHFFAFKEKNKKHEKRENKRIKDPFSFYFSKIHTAFKDKKSNFNN